MKIRRYYVVSDRKSGKRIVTLLKDDFKRSIYADVVEGLKNKKYKIEVF